jgi:chromosome segregation ATPase
VIPSFMPGALLGGVWEAVEGYFHECITSDMEKRNIAVQQNQKFLRNYQTLLKDLYGTRFLMADDAADLAEKYARLVQNAKDNSGPGSGITDSYVNKLNSQATALRGLRPEDVAGLSNNMIEDFRALEQKVKEQRSGREVYQEQIDKLSALTDHYASMVEQATSQKEKILALNDKVRLLNEKIAAADRRNAQNKERMRALQERLALSMETMQEKARSLRDDLDDMKARQEEQKVRLQALQEKMNARMGR